MRLNQNIKDLFHSFAKKPNKDSNSYPFEISLQYKNFNNHLPLLGEQTNQLARIEELITGIVIKPKQIFSFWKTVGNPSLITNDNNYLMVFELVTSMIYYLSLLSGLSIIERHHNLTDNFEDEERLFPLGADAKILFKSKDLRIKNNYSFPVKLKIIITSQHINGYILSTEKLVSNEVVFKCRNFKNYKEVLTRINRRTIEVSVYKKN